MLDCLALHQFPFVLNLALYPFFLQPHVQHLSGILLFLYSPSKRLLF
jgi:hypothetical protein